MTTQTQNIPRWFKSQPQKLQSSKIDTAAGIIHDVVMCQAGPAKGHGVHLEEEFIADLVAYDNKHYQSTGLKSRFGHPSLSDTTMGTQMGVFKNFRKRGEQAIADLHLLDSSNKSPKNPGMKDWMLQMAEEDPSFVMMSIVFSPEDHYQYDDDGSQVSPYKQNDDGSFVTDERGRNILRYSDRKIFVKFGTKGIHHYTDAVEAGAATDALFSNQFNQDKFGVQASTWLQEHPELLNFLKKNPEKIFQFADSCGIDLPKPKLNFQDKAAGLKAWLFGTKEGEEIDLANRIPALEEEAKEWQKKANTLSGQIEQLNQQLTQAKARITELEAQPAADPTTGILNTQLGPPKERAYKADPVTEKARQFFQSMHTD